MSALAGTPPGKPFRPLLSPSRSKLLRSWVAAPRLSVGPGNREAQAPSMVPRPSCRIPLPHPLAAPRRFQADWYQSQNQRPGDKGWGGTGRGRTHGWGAGEDGSTRSNAKGQKTREGREDKSLPLCQPRGRG